MHVPPVTITLSSSLLASGGQCGSTRGGGGTSWVGLLPAGAAADSVGHSACNLRGSCICYCWLLTLRLTSEAHFASCMCAMHALHSWEVWWTGCWFTLVPEVILAVGTVAAIAQST
jgi:hypothetical protein